MKNDPSFLRGSLASILALALPALAQIDLGGVSLRTVRATDIGVVALPRFDSVGLDVRVDHGVARTKATLVWTATAGSRTQYHWSCAEKDFQGSFVSEQSWLPYEGTYYHDTLVTYTYQTLDKEGKDSSYTRSYVQRVTSCHVDSVSFVEAEVDSMELSAGFSLPTDAAVTDLALWVGKERQSAWIMDRRLAREQYNQIVGARRDPALLETWGSSHYSLRVFPQATGETRRLELEFTQAFRPGMVLPLRISAPPSHSVWYQADTGYATSRRVSSPTGRVVIRLASEDGTPVALDLGEHGSISAADMSQERILTEPDRFSAVAAKGVREVWTATKDGRAVFGARVVFQGEEFTVEDAPTERVVLLDAIHAAERARRLALLSLNQYGQDGNKVNLAWVAKDGSIQHLWKAPREFQGAAVEDALKFLKAWAPGDSLDPETALRSLTESDSGRVVVILTDLSGKFFSQPYPNSRDFFVIQGDTTVFDQGAYNLATAKYSAHSQQFYQDQDDLWTALGKTFKSKNMKLFGWWRDGYMYNVASQTGGYHFGDLEWGSWRWWRTGDSLIVPELFGANRRGWVEGIQSADLQTSGLKVDSLVHNLQQGGYYGYMPWIDFAPDIRVATLDLKAARQAPASQLLAARSASVTLPDSFPVVLAGRQSTSGTLDLDLTGYWGGLEVKARRSIAVGTGGGSAGAGIWAVEYAGKVQPWIWSFDSVYNAVRNLGRSYRVATTATSFLALEPGVKPFDSLGGQGERTDLSASSKSAEFSVVNDMAEGGILLDSLSLESLLLGRIVSVDPRANVAARGMRVVSGRELTILGGPSDMAPQVRILDVSGRELATPRLERDGNGWRATWKPLRASVVVVQMFQDGKMESQRAVVRP
ncbi:MAG: hypothetical protein H6686_12075 [Fibrobacteria bacterium]|nr:hypothetical protein [Fibrobacteria bacterium]